jgi:AraC-like DNA-binding protein
MHLESIAPRPELACAVERFFITKANIIAQSSLNNTLLPSIMQSILLNLNGNAQYIKPPIGESRQFNENLILGQYTKSFSSTLAGEIDYIGIHFTSTGLYRLLKLPMHKFSNQVHVLNYVLNNAGELTDKLSQVQETLDRIKIIEDFLLKNLMPVSQGLQQTAIVSEKIKSEMQISLADLSKQYGMSERTMQRYFLKYIGVSPKNFSRIARFNTVTKLIETNQQVNWQELFINLGYTDHSHFVNDFKDITGQTPTQYFKSKTYYEKFFYGS